MGKPRRLLTAAALAAAVVVVAAAGAARAAPPLTDPPPTLLPLEHWAMAPTPPPRPAAASINLTACTVAYQANRDGAAYLCCVDPSLGYCGGRLELAPKATVCTVDWRTFPVGLGQQCCFRARPDAAGRVPALTADATWARGPPQPPFLDVTCRAYGPCPDWAPHRPTVGNEGTPTEAVIRCGSHAPSAYRRCEVTVCSLVIRRTRGLNIPRNPQWRKKVPFCGPTTFGTSAQCCLQLKKWAERARCCRTCRRPGLKSTSWGCCTPGKRPAKTPKPTPRPSASPKPKWGPSSKK